MVTDYDITHSYKINNLHVDYTRKIETTIKRKRDIRPVLEKTEVYLSSVQRSQT